MRGVAHISFSGGGVFIPARNPYDRQLLVEHVTERARAKGMIKVTVDDRCWSVHLNRTAASAWCSHCGRVLQATCSSTLQGGAPYCLKCAFGEDAALLSWHPGPHQAAV